MFDVDGDFRLDSCRHVLVYAISVDPILNCLSQLPCLQGSTVTGGKGAFTQWVWVELIESTETICPADTHQVHAEFI